LYRILGGLFFRLGGNDVYDHWGWTIAALLAERRKGRKGRQATLSSESGFLTVI
jgi:hypothetical protein